MCDLDYINSPHPGSGLKISIKVHILWPVPWYGLWLYFLYTSVAGLLIFHPTKAILLIHKHCNYKGEYLNLMLKICHISRGWNPAENFWTPKA